MPFAARSAIVIRAEMVAMVAGVLAVSLLAVARLIAAPGGSLEG